MWEIAARAGATTVYAWGNKATDGADYAVCYNNKNNITAVGTYSANAWGLFDMFGDTFEYCLDDDSRTDLADAPDAFTAAYGGSSKRRQVRGDYYAHALSQPGFKASNRQTVTYDNDNSYFYSYRLAVIMQ
jgi:formylglycine-generating enzyme required for sulfatase activity